MPYIIVLILLWRAIWQQEFFARADEMSSLSSQVKTAIRSQRDLMSNISIDQLPLVGVNLRSVLFNEKITNETAALTALQNLMEDGVQNFVLDLEQNDDVWTIPNTTLTFSSLLTTFQSYINVTDDTLSANMLVLLLKIAPASGANNSTTGNVVSTNTSQPLSNITYLLDQNMGRDHIYIPEDLENDRQSGATYNIHGASANGWPTLELFLYQKRRRLVITELTDNLNYSDVPYIFDRSILHYDKGNTTLEAPKTVTQFINISSISWRFLESTFNEEDIREYVNGGYSPVIANQYSTENITQISNILNSSIIWSWSQNQPLITHADMQKSTDSLVAYNCAVLKYTASNSSAYWLVDNCYERNQGLCRYERQSYAWLITEVRDTYFAFDMHSGSRCPTDYEFALPRTPLEQTSLTIFLANASSELKTIWIDINSIAVSNCWVTGGPYATCPYQKVISRRNFVAMLTPVTVCSFVILVMVSYLNILRVPIHNNRKNWRRIVNEVSKSEIEGVPS